MHRLVYQSYVYISNKNAIAFFLAMRYTEFLPYSLFPVPYSLFPIPYLFRERWAIIRRRV